MEMIVKLFFGSNLYGTSTPESDVDYKGVYLPRMRDCLLGRINPSIEFNIKDKTQKNTSEDEDYGVYSLQYFLQMASEGQMVALDMLHAPKSKIIVSSPEWEELHNNRHRFYTKRLFGYMKYIREQAAKYSIKGLRLSAMEELLSVLDKHDDEDKLSSFWSELPINKFCLEVENPKESRWRYYQCCGKMCSETMKVKHARESVLHTYNQYGTRAQLAKENKGIDWKALSHSYRAGLQVKEIFETGDLKYPLKDATTVRDLKLGRLHYQNDGVGEMLEKLHIDVEELAAKSSLPEAVDTQWVDDFVVSCYL